jgi:hypothetical protein
VRSFCDKSVVPGSQVQASHYTGDDLSELKPIAFVGSIPIRWECSSCGKKFWLHAMSERLLNPRVAVYGRFERHKCVVEASRAAHKATLRRMTEERRLAKERRRYFRGTARRVKD